MSANSNPRASVPDLATIAEVLEIGAEIWRGKCDGELAYSGVTKENLSIYIHQDCIRRVRLQHGFPHKQFAPATSPAPASGDHDLGQQPQSSRVDRKTRHSSHRSSHPHRDRHGHRSSRRNSRSRDRRHRDRRDDVYDLTTSTNPSKLMQPARCGEDFDATNNYDDLTHSNRQGQMQQMLTSATPSRNDQSDITNKPKPSAGPHIVIARNFAAGTTAADIERAMAPIGGEIRSCAIVSHSPTTAEIVFEKKEGADNVIGTFHNQTADGRLLSVFFKPTTLSQMPEEDVDDGIYPNQAPSSLQSLVQSRMQSRPELRLPTQSSFEYSNPLKPSQMPNQHHQSLVPHPSKQMPAHTESGFEGFLGNSALPSSSL